MINYKITFLFDIEEVLDYDSDNQKASIDNFDDKCLDKVFDNENKIKEFENWYNNGDDLKITVIDIKYNSEEIDIDKFKILGIINVTLESELPQNIEKSFADELIYYMFEEEFPSVSYSVTGTAYKDIWRYDRDSHDQELIDVEYSEKESIISYSNVTIQKIN